MCTGGSPLQLVVRTLSACATRGALEFGSLRMPCALGRSGRRTRKREGDGASPSGVWHMRQAFFRADRLSRPVSGLPLRAISPQDGWCDESGDRNYNRRIRHPYPASAEHLWREDGLYDVIVVLGYNDRPRRKGRGSAIFLHCAREGFQPTAGCIGVSRSDLIRLMPCLTRRTRLLIP
jgi:L,D-peptidoglycan transpeptidase YkuD (ErfK/YbiS/YcfS/YnhG family)